MIDFEEQVIVFSFLVVQIWIKILFSIWGIS